MASRWDELSTNELFAKLRASDEAELREYLIERHEGLVRHVAKAYQESTESYEDILSVGREGLINAVDRFDPERGTKFATFAVPTIRGEIQRYFRDQTWGIHVPRRIQELSTIARQAREALTQQQGRAPTYSEIAMKLGVAEEELIEAVEVGRQYDLISLDAGAGPDADEEGSYLDQAGDEDEAIQRLAERDELASAMEQLPARQRVILALRFFGGLSQQEVARRLGISQMHVSRLQHKATDRLKQILQES